MQKSYQNKTMKTSEISQSADTNSNWRFSLISPKKLKWQNSDDTTSIASKSSKGKLTFMLCYMIHESERCDKQLKSSTAEHL